MAIKLFEGLPDRDDESPARGAGCVSSRSGHGRTVFTGD